MYHLVLARRALFVLLAALLLSACRDGYDPRRMDKTDRPLLLGREDYRHIIKDQVDYMNRDIQESAGLKVSVKTKAPPIPDIAPILASPIPPEVGNTKQVSISVTDDVPLKDVLIELARLADVDIEIDSGIEGGVTFRASERPFNEVVERISDLAGLRYSMRSGVLRVERDLPFVDNYNLDFLNIIRSSKSSTNISTDVLALANSASGEGGGGSGISTGSTASITSDATDDFWESLEEGIKRILLANAPKLHAVADTGEEQSAPADPDEMPQGSYYIINKQAGILSVSATKKQHRAINILMEQLSRNASAQVLIEAKVVEVSLTDEYASGVDWSALKGQSTIGLQHLPTAIGESLTSIDVLQGTLGIGLTGSVKLMEQFGATRTLSSPRLHAINNQPAVLTFAENKVFFEVKVTQEDAEVVDGSTVNQPKLTVESTRRSVPIGIILNILPSINLDRGEVTLSVRPTLSRQVSTVADPGSALVNQIISQDNPEAVFTNEIPIIEVREMDSILKVKSGQIMVIGGLMEQSSTNTDTGMPIASEIPWFGNLFKSVEKEDKNKELIIFIKATIVGTNGNYTNADRKVYEKFSNDYRPLF